MTAKGFVKILLAKEGLKMTELVALANKSGNKKYFLLFLSNLRMKQLEM